MTTDIKWQAIIFSVTFSDSWTEILPEYVYLKTIIRNKYSVMLLTFTMWVGDQKRQLISFSKYHIYQGRIQDLWLGWVGEGSGDHIRSPLKVPSGSRAELCGFEELDIYLNDNFEPTTPFLSNQKNLTLSLNFVGNC